MPTSPLAARRLIVAAYILLTVAGAAAMFWPTPTVGQAGRALSDFWALFLIVGGLTSAVGACRRRWTGEFMGLPLLITVWAVYGLGAGWTAATDRPSAWAGCTGLLAVAFLLGARWETIAIYRRAARQNADRRDRQEPS